MEPAGGSHHAGDENGVKLMGDCVIRTMFLERPFWFGEG